MYVFLLAPSAFGAPTIMGGREGGRREKGRERTKVRGFYDIPRRRQERQHKGPREGRRRADCCFRKDPAGIRVPRGIKYSGMRCTF